jgi:hypothetical protein
MESTLGAKRLHRLDVQGFDMIDEDVLARIAPWLRLAFGLCGMVAIVGTALASTPILLTLAAIAFLATVLPVHPFDLIYNLGIRHLTGTPPLPKRGPPSRFASGVGALWLIVTVGAFDYSFMVVGYVLGYTLALTAVLVSATDICIPSILFRAMLGSPWSRAGRTAESLGQEAREPPINRREQDRLYRW